jgi:hypothetical protein
MLHARSTLRFPLYNLSAQSSGASLCWPRWTFVEHCHGRLPWLICRVSDFEAATAFELAASLAHDQKPRDLGSGRQPESLPDDGLRTEKLAGAASGTCASCA